MSEKPVVPKLWMDTLPRVGNAAQAVRAAQAAGQEESAVKYVLALLQLEAQTFHRAAKERTGNTTLTFALFHELMPEFPVRLAVSRLRFDYDGIASELLNDVTETPMYAAWDELRQTFRSQEVALIFKWPRIKRCKQFCVFHELVRYDTDFAFSSLPKKDPRRGFRIALPGASRHDRLFSIEPLPAFLAALRVLPDNPDAEDEE